MESAADSKKLKDMLEMERVFQFLLGLNPEFDQACEKILGKDLFLDLDEAFSHIHGEESRKELIGNKTENCGSLTTENSALAVAKQNQNASDNKKPVDKDKIKGGNQPTRLGQANHTAIVEERSAQLGFNKSDLENLKHLLNQLEDSNANPSSNSGSCSMAQLEERTQRAPNARRQGRRARVDDFDDYHEDEFEDEEDQASLNHEGRFAPRGERRGRGFQRAPK
ncbi:hypothetical protein CK203_025483 [Vitis vinifera]|uniref:Uncharacterized protein n=1 Tax=Vitis vinifera TaxID=29760 RepID=A0A438IZE5_VITVI|nr:hypothetical protein CK203_025483 [Vitis vinifera]